MVRAANPKLIELEANAILIFDILRARVRGGDHDPRDLSLKRSGFHISKDT